MRTSWRDPNGYDARVTRLRAWSGIRGMTVHGLRRGLLADSDPAASGGSAASGSGKSDRIDRSDLAASIGSGLPLDRAEIQPYLDARADHYGLEHS